MQIEVSEKEYCVLQCHYECDKEAIEKKKDDVLQQFKKAPVRGTRPGKRADMTSIKLQYAKQIDESLQRALAEQAYLDTIFDRAIKPFGMPEFSATKLERDKFSCDFSMKKKPDFELGQYKDLELPLPPLPSTVEAAAQELMQELRIRFGESTQFDENDIVEMADNATVDYDVFDVASDTKVEALCIKEQLLTIGRSKLDGFDEGLLGMKIGDTHEFVLKIPDVGLPSIAGKDLKFVVTLLSGAKITPNPLDDTLAIKMKKKDFTEVQSFASQYASAKLQDQLRQLKVTALSNKLVEDHAIVMPEWLLTSEAQYLVASAKVDWNTLPKMDQDQYLKAAERTVKLAIILDRIRENEPETQLADQEVIEMIRNMLAKAGANVDQMMEEFSRNGQLVILTARIRDEYALDFLVKNTKWIE